jgi:hypothetical protein
VFEQKIFFSLKIYGKLARLSNKVEPSMVFDQSEFEGPRFDLYICKRVPVKCETKSKRNESKRNKSKRNSPKRNEIYLVSFRFRFVSVNFVSFRFISFRFDFVSHFTCTRRNACYVIFWNIAPKHWIFISTFTCILNETTKMHEEKFVGLKKIHNDITIFYI